MNVCAAWPRTWCSPRSLVCDGLEADRGQTSSLDEPSDATGDNHGRVVRCNYQQKDAEINAGKRERAIGGYPSPG